MTVAPASVPSTVNPARRLSFSCRWTTLTASPVAPSPRRTIRRTHVHRRPSRWAGSPRDAWKERSALTVAGSKTPECTGSGRRLAKQPLDRADVGTAVAGALVRVDRRPGARDARAGHGQDDHGGRDQPQAGDGTWTEATGCQAFRAPTRSG